MPITAATTPNAYAMSSAVHSFIPALALPADGLHTALTLIYADSFAGAIGNGHGCRHGAAAVEIVDGTNEVGEVSKRGLE